MATFDSHKNFAQTLVAVAPSPATTGTSLTVSTGTGALFPATPFNATVQPVGVIPTPTNAEIVRVTNITGDVLTITRTQEGTSALAIAVGYQIGATVTAKTLTDIETAVGTTQMNITASAGNSAVLNAEVTGDTNVRYQLQASGAMNWGSGSASTDVNLYRALAGTLKTDNSFSIGNQLTVSSYATFNNTATFNAQAAINRTTDSSAINATYTTTSNATNAAFAYTSVDNTGRLVSAQVAGDSFGRFLIDVNGTATWGPGNAARDTTLERVGVGQLGTPGTVLVGSTTALGDNGAGEIQLANASTVPTTNPTAGVDVYAASGTSTPIKIRDTAGNVRSLADAVTVLASTSGAITTTAMTAVSGLAVTVEANATYLMEAVFYLHSTVSTSDSATYTWTGPSGATMQWGDTNTTSDYNATLTTVASGDVTLDTKTHLLCLKGTLVVSTTAGTLTPTFGVSATTSSPSYTVLSGSYVRLTRIV